MSEEQKADFKIRDLERQASDLQKSGLLTEMRDDLNEIDAMLTRLPGRLGEARTRGYVFKSYLEPQIGSLATQWKALRESVRREIERRTLDLDQDLRRVEPAVRRLQPYMGSSLSAAQSAIDRTASELESVDRRVRAASEAVQAMFGSTRSDANNLNAQVEECIELLDWMEQASFGFLAGEAGVAAVQGRWLKDGNKEGPKGILFLTDQRVIFEQREKIATKKFLFVTTASEEVKALQWEAPVEAVEGTEATEKRQALIVKHEHLRLNFRRPASVREVLVQLQADSETWQALINRVVSGEINQERIAGAEKAAEKAVGVEIPSKCPSCGAILDVDVIRGMTAITCRFCGTKIPLVGA
jgi:hypothetical protein